jgi:predicted metal-binding protein
MTTRIFVCVSCRRNAGDEDDGSEEPGRSLVAAIETRLQGQGRPDLSVVGVDCLAVCKRPCTIALCGAAKWAYLIGDIDPEQHADDIVAAAKSFAASDNGIVPWRERPLSFRRGVIARVPPLAHKEPT